MSTSASGESGPNGAVGGLDDTGVPGAGECGAGKAYCKRFRRLAAKGDYTGLAFVEEDRERPMATVLAFIERKGFGDKPVAIAVKQSSEGSCTGCHVKCCAGYNGTEWEDKKQVVKRSTPAPASASAKAVPERGSSGRFTKGGRKKCEAGGSGGKVKGAPKFWSKRKAGLVNAADSASAELPAPMKQLAVAFTLSGEVDTSYRSCMGGYKVQERVNDGRPTYMGGRDCDRWVYYHDGAMGEWFVGDEGDIGTGGGYMFVEGSNAATPDATTATWTGWDGITLSGLPVGHEYERCMGGYELHGEGNHDGRPAVGTATCGCFITQGTVCGSSVMKPTSAAPATCPWRAAMLPLRPQPQRHGMWWKAVSPTAVWQ